MCSANTASSTSAERARRLHGRTRAGRLTALDALIVRREAALLARMDGAFRDALCVDLGVGDEPFTTLENARCVRSCNPELRVIGVDCDARRLKRARRAAGGELDFRLGSFELPLVPGERVRLVRAMNVLRDYDEHEARAAQHALGAALLPGGLLIEGSSSLSGGVLCANLLRKCDEALVHEALLFSTDFSQGFAPLLFRDRLPRDLRRACRPGSAIHEFFRAWTEAFGAARSTGLRDAAASFALSGALLARRVSGVLVEAASPELGALSWRPQGKAD